MHFSFSHECRAFLGSPKIFQDPRVFIPYIAMEWTFATVAANGTRVFPQSCPENELKRLTSHFFDNGYSPHNEMLRKLSRSNSFEWFGNVVWIHEYAKPVIF